MVHNSSSEYVWGYFRIMFLFIFNGILDSHIYELLWMKTDAQNIFKLYWINQLVWTLFNMMNIMKYEYKFSFFILYSQEQCIVFGASSEKQQLSKKQGSYFYNHKFNIIL